MEVGPRRRRPLGAPLIHLVLLVLASALVSPLSPLSPAAAAAPEREEQQPALEWVAAINGRPVAEIDANEPLRLNPAEGAQLELTLTNTAPEEVTIRSVRLEGSVMGLTMYNFTTRIDLLMPPDSITTRRIDVDLIDLSGQATGLIPSGLQVLDDERNVLLEESFPADIRGSVTSIYGVFGLAVLGITLVLLVSLLLAIRRSQLPENRWQRAMRFVPVGIGIGFVLTFTLSATRQLSPSAGSWTTVVLLCAAGGLVIGYFLPFGVAGEETTSDIGYAEPGTEGDNAPVLDTAGADSAVPEEGQLTTEQPAGHWWSDAPEVSSRDRSTPEDDW